VLDLCFEWLLPLWRLLFLLSVDDLQLRGVPARHIALPFKDGHQLRQHDINRNLSVGSPAYVIPKQMNDLEHSLEVRDGACAQFIRANLGIVVGFRGSSDPLLRDPSQPVQPATNLT